MPSLFGRSALLALVFGGLVAMPLAAQGSAYVPLDDPSLPLFEHLVARGSVVDPSPFVRPFRRAEAVKVLKSAVGDSASVRVLLARWDRPDSLWEATLRAGGEAFTSGRRDLLHPAAGTGDVTLYGDLRLEASLGGLALVTRPAIDMRASLDDPDWAGERGGADQTCCRWRFPEAYLTWAAGIFHLNLGQIARNWGPVGVAGIAISDVAYPRDEISLEVRSRDLHLLSVVSQLHDTTDDVGAVIHRYHVATRWGLRLSDRLNVAAWQTALLQGRDRQLEGPFRNPLIFLPFTNQYGTGDEGSNVMVGVQGEYRLGRATSLQGELALDDFIQENRDKFPNRFAFTLAATGPAPAGTAFRILYTRASSFAFRTFNPNENFTERGVGLGRGFDDDDQITLALTKPVAPEFLAGVDLTILRQGEGSLDAPVNPVEPVHGTFLGTVEQTIRAAGRLNGMLGPFSINGELGLNHVTNAGHISGQTTNHLEGRLMALLQFGAKGILR